MSFLTGKSGNLWNVQFQKNPEVNAFHSFSLPADQKSLSFLQFLPNFSYKFLVISQNWSNKSCKERNLSRHSWRGAKRRSLNMRNPEDDLRSRLSHQLGNVWCVMYKWHSEREKQELPSSSRYFLNKFTDFFLFLAKEFKEEMKPFVRISNYVLFHWVIAYMRSI